MPRQSLTSSPWVLPVITLCLTAALAALCVWQWTRESRLTADLRDQTRRAIETEHALEETRAQADRLRGENLRVTALLEQQSSHLAKAVEQAEALQDDASKHQKARAEADALRARLEEAAASVAQANQRIVEANDRILAQNQSVADANEIITRLTTERDEAVRLLNERTEEYNRLARSVEESRR